MMQRYSWSRWFLWVAVGLMSVPAILSAAEKAKPAAAEKTKAVAAEKAKPAAAEAAKAAAPEHDAKASITPAPRPDAWWQQRHESMNARVKKGNVDLLLIGDSITHGWEGGGKDVWAKFYEKRNAVNLGIGGDRTQHVLWRLENGNIEGIKPKLAVIMIGTNNSGTDTVPEIADGVRAIVKKLRTTLPDTKILLLGIFPRDEQPSKRRGDLLQVNQIIARLDDGKNVHYMDIGSRFVDDNGSIPKEIMPDFLHPSPAGYQIWADAIEAKVAELMGEK
jgi:beta-glucosidase